MNIEQFESRYKKAVAEVEKSRTAYYKADADESPKWLKALDRYEAACEDLSKIKDERRDKIEGCRSLMRNYEFHVGIAKTNLKVYEEALAKKQAEYDRLVVMHITMS
jgi:hypothetical protein